MHLLLNSTVQKGCDHSTGGAIIGAALKAAGYTGIFRYAAEGRGSVNVTAAEVADLRAHGIQVAIVNEFAADYLLGGTSVGHLSAIGARNVTRAAGLPDGLVFMAGDFDATAGNPAAATNANMRAIAAALRGAQSALGGLNVGFYGGYWAIDWLVAHGPANLIFWQCASAYGAPGRVHPRAVALQKVGNVTVGGVSLDADDDLAPYWGQRNPPIPPPPEGTMAITAATNMDGRLEVFVEKTDGEVFHTWQQTAGSAFVGAKTGVRTAEWHSLGTPGK